MTDEQKERAMHIMRDADGETDGMLDFPPMSVRERWESGRAQWKPTRAELERMTLAMQNQPNRAMFEDEPDPERRAMQREPDDLYDLSGGYEDQRVPISKPAALGIVAVCTAGILLWIVGMAYARDLWAWVTR